MLFPADSSLSTPSSLKEEEKKTCSEEIHKQLHGKVVAEKNLLTPAFSSVLSGSSCCPILTYTVKMVLFPDCTRVTYRSLLAMMV